MFRNVPECFLFLVLPTPNKFYANQKFNSNVKQSRLMFFSYTYLLLVVCRKAESTSLPSLLSLTTVLFLNANPVERILTPLRPVTTNLKCNINEKCDNF